MNRQKITHFLAPSISYAVARLLWAQALARLTLVGVSFIA